jgi:hypothetical protein
MKKTVEEMKQQYETACNAYLRAFCEKHDFEYEPDAWVLNEVGEIACVADYYVSMPTIRYDIDNDVDENEFVRWYDYCIRASTLVPTPNFRSWCKGCPVESPEQLEKLESARRKIRGIEKDFKKLIDEHDNDLPF